MPEKERWKQLQEWDNAPYAKECHPREEHLISLIVAVGTAEERPLVPLWDVDLIH